MKSTRFHAVRPTLSLARICLLSLTLCCLTFVTSTPARALPTSSAENRDQRSGVQLALDQTPGNSELTRASKPPAELLGKSGIFNILDVGATNNGLDDDDTPYIQRALDLANGAGGGTVVIPCGTFRLAGNKDSSLHIYSKTEIVGYGACSVLYFDDKESIPRQNNDLLIASNVSDIAIRNLTITGTALISPNETNQKQGLTGRNVRNLTIEGVTFENLRYMATAFSDSTNVRFFRNSLKYIVRDGLRCTNCDDVQVVGNHFVGVADDSVALHSLDNSGNPSGGYLVSNNVFEQSQSVKILGAKAAIITSNVFRRMLRGAILVSIPANGPEGSTPIFDVDVSHNVIEDTLSDRGTNYSIRVSSASRSPLDASGNSATQDLPYQTNYAVIGKSRQAVRSNATNILISDNIVTRTQPSGLSYSEYGHGSLFDRVTNGFLSNPVISDSSFQTVPISIIGTASAITVTNNNISGCGVGMPGIAFDPSSKSSGSDLRNVSVSNNTVTDCPGIGVSINAQGGLIGAATISGNRFDLDPFFRAPSHQKDNTWNSADNVIGIRAAGADFGLQIVNNNFSNLGKPVSVGAGALSYTDNYVFADISESGNSAQNKGVRYIDSGLRGNIFVDIDGNPSSPTFGKVTSAPLLWSTQQPSSGFYVAGHCVRASYSSTPNPSSSNSVPTEWCRLTTGSTHRPGIDWLEIRGAVGASGR